MKYKKEDWVVGRMYKFVGGESTYTCGGFTLEKSYVMVEDVDWYNSYLIKRGVNLPEPDSVFIGDDGTKWRGDLRNFVPVEQS